MIPSRRVFDEYAGEYDRWFDEHEEVYQAQVRMLRGAIPYHGRGLEVGVGSGRFAMPLGIRYGIDPSRGLVRMAQQWGIEVVLGEGEHLPYRAGSFDDVLMMTVICFPSELCSKPSVSWSNWVVVGNAGLRKVPHIIGIGFEKCISHVL